MVRHYREEDEYMTIKPKVRLIRIGSLKRDTRASFIGNLVEGVIRYQQP